MANFRTSENRRVADYFVRSLRGEYGRDVTHAALESSGLNPVLTRGKPLRARHVRQVVKRADALLADVRKRNAELSASFARPVALGTYVSLLQIKIDDAARRRFGSNPTLAKLVDVNRVAPRVEKAIVDAGRNGNHFVTSEEAAVAELPGIGHEDRAALLVQVLHDSVPARLVPAMGKALGRVQDDVVALGTGLKTSGGAMCS